MGEMLNRALNQVQHKVKHDSFFSALKMLKGNLWTFYVRIHNVSDSSMDRRKVRLPKKKIGSPGIKYGAGLVKREMTSVRGFTWSCKEKGKTFLLFFPKEGLSFKGWNKSI